MKNVQIITKKIRALHYDEDKETVRQRIEQHINNGWELKNTNMFSWNNEMFIYALLIKE